MSGEIIVALIALGASILNALYSAWLSRNINRDRERWEREQLFKPERKKEFDEMIKLVQDALKGRLNIDKATDFLRDHFIWGTDGSIRAWSKFMSEARQKSGEMKAEVAMRGFLEIYLAARKAFYPDTKVSIDDLGKMYFTDWEKYRIQVLKIRL